MQKTKQAVNQQESQLPKFTEVISIEIPVEIIHQRLLAELPVDYKHREILAHAIIGGTPNLSYIYNALGGYTNDIDFEEGDMVICPETEKYERYDANLEQENGEPNNQPAPTNEEDYKPLWKIRSVAIGECRINKINMYDRNKLIVEFIGWDKYGRREEVQHAMVDHKKCTKIPVPELQAVANR